MTAQCPLCSSQLASSPSSDSNDGSLSFNCPDCGTYRLADDIGDLDQQWIRNHSAARIAAVRYAIRNHLDVDADTTIDYDKFEALTKTPLPKLHKQSEQLLRLFAERSEHDPGSTLEIRREHVQPYIGAVSLHGVVQAFNALVEGGLIQGRERSGSLLQGALTARGSARLEELEQSEPNPSDRAECVVFYAWQNNLHRKTNRFLIRDALLRAVKKITRTDTAPLMRVDSDTQGVAGSPDIVRTILGKIDRSTVFVADVSLVDEPHDRAESRACNSNVMFELGYALKTLGEEKIILLFNEAYGVEKQLPFDLGLKRAMLYTAEPGASDLAALRKELAEDLERAICMALELDDQ